MKYTPETTNAQGEKVPAKTEWIYAGTHQETYTIMQLKPEAQNRNPTTIVNHYKEPASIEQAYYAINHVSQLRGDLGAYHNRLEHMENANGNASENLQASESRIRDVDMASEMMSMVKQNVLQQSVQAMLSQANQLPQNILQLLQ